MQYLKTAVSEYRFSGLFFESLQFRRFPAESLRRSATHQPLPWYSQRSPCLPGPSRRACAAQDVISHVFLRGTMIHAAVNLLFTFLTSYGPTESFVCESAIYPFCWGERGSSGCRVPAGSSHKADYRRLP